MTATLLPATAGESSPPAVANGREPIAYVIAWSPQGFVPRLVLAAGPRKDGPRGLYYRTARGDWTVDPLAARSYPDWASVLVDLARLSLDVERYRPVGLVTE